MSVYFSVRVNRELVCDCKAYRFPHKPESALCKVKVPPIHTIPYQFRITSEQLRYVSELLKNINQSNNNHR
jgi:hypothetical protein